MESGVHHAKGTIRTNRNVLQSLELPRHFPTVHERFVQGHDSRGMAHCLHGRHADHLPKQGGRHRKDKKGPTKNEGTRPSPETQEMPIWSRGGRFPGPDPETRRNRHGPHQNSPALQSGRPQQRSKTFAHSSDSRTTTGGSSGTTQIS